MNLQHTKAASMGLANRFATDHLDIAFIQQPDQYKQQIKTSTGELVYNTNNERRPRASRI